MVFDTNPDSDFEDTDQQNAPMIRAYQFRRDESDILEVRRLGASIEGKPLTYEEPASLRKSLPGDDT